MQNEFVSIYNAYVKENFCDEKEIQKEIIKDGPAHLDASINYAKSQIIGQTNLNYMIILNDQDKMEHMARAHMNALKRIINIDIDQFPLIATMGFDIKTKEPAVFHFCNLPQKAGILWGESSTEMIKAIKERDKKQPEFTSRCILVKNKREMYETMIAWEIDLLQEKNTFIPDELKL
jgi:hypothetical protein